MNRRFSAAVLVCALLSQIMGARAAVPETLVAQQTRESAVNAAKQSSLKLRQHRAPEFRSGNLPLSLPQRSIKVTPFERSGFAVSTARLLTRESLVPTTDPRTRSASALSSSAAAIIGTFRRGASKSVSVGVPNRGAQAVVQVVVPPHESPIGVPTPHVSPTPFHTPTPFPSIAPTMTPTPTPAPTPVPTTTPSPSPQTNLTARVTGFLAWWPYYQTNVPGVGPLAVNMENGNALLVSRDISIPVGPQALSFTRIYNSLSLHNVANSDGSQPAIFGNGWTNEYDMHLSYNAAQNIMSVFDVDGARYDYTAVNGVWTPPAGQYAKLTMTSCDYVLTKPSGDEYVFVPPFAQCSGVPAGMYGRLIQIIGRNQNNTITLTYSLSGSQASIEDITQVSVASNFGRSLTLTFGTFGSYTELASITRPDGLKTSYSYDTSGDLTEVSFPPSNTARAYSEITFAYEVVNGREILDWVGNPNYNFGAIGGGVQLFFSGTAQIASLQHWGTINPDLPGTGQAVQPSFPTGNVAWSLANFTISSTSPESTDNDGHATLWDLDSSGRQTSVAGWNGSAWISSGMAWDASNDVIATIDPNDNETDMAYGTNSSGGSSGQIVAIAQPSVATSSGTFRPTSLYSYDAYNNVVAECDPVATNALGLNWTAAPSGNSLCPESTVATRFSYSYLSYEPYGELASQTSAAFSGAPSGYTTSYTYATTQQGGIDHGLVTNVSSPSIPQIDGSTRQPNETLSYDAYGNEACDGSSLGLEIYTYDSMNRILTKSDADDASLTSAVSGCAKTPGIPGSTIVTGYTYGPDGTVETVESSAGGSSSSSSSELFSYTYDNDDNVIAQTGIDGTTDYTYDGDDRLVIVQPAVTSAYPGTTFYLYDLEQGAGLDSTLSGISVAGHGGLFEVQQSTTSNSQLIDSSITAYDALLRPTTTYTFAPCPAPAAGTSGAVFCGNTTAEASTYTYDSPGKLGLLTSTTNALGVVTMPAYDVLNRLVAVQFSGGPVSTPAQTRTFNPDGQIASVNVAGVGTESYSYNPLGLLSSYQEPSGDQVSYGYYADGLRSSLSINNSHGSYANALEYSYRLDGLPSTTTATWPSAATISDSYTAAGRPTQQVDVSPVASISASYNASGELATYTIPAGTYSNFTYNVAHEMTGYQAYNGQTVTIAYDATGAIAKESLSSTGTIASVTPYNGALIQGNTTAYDGRTGAPLRDPSGAYSYDAMGRMTGVAGTAGYNPTVVTVSYDALNRFVGGSSIAALTDSTECAASTGAPGITAPSVRFTGANDGYVYGPDGNISTDNVQTSGNIPAAQNWHWDGDQLLYTETNGSMDGLMVGTDGIIPANGSTGLTVTDREPNGNATSQHNATGNSGWTITNPFVQPCGISAGAPTTGYIQPTFGAFAPPSYVAPGLLSDGFNDLEPFGALYDPISMAVGVAGGSGSDAYSRGQLPGDRAPRYALSTTDGCGALTRTAAGDCAIIANPYSAPPSGGILQVLGLPPPAPGAQPGSGLRTIGRTGIRYKKRPPNAVKCTGGGVSFYAPPNYSVNIPVAAGRKGGVWGVGQVGQFGSLDYQRNGTPASFDFYSDYTPVSNVNVGAYLYGAGFGERQMDMIGNAYGTLMSSNAGDPNQKKFWNVGWSMANSGGDFSCGR